MILLLAIVIIFFLVIPLIKKSIFNATREKLDNEEKKYKFLENKYKHLLESNKEDVIELFIAIPKHKSDNWIVSKRIRTGTWIGFINRYFIPFADDTEYIKIIEISDVELSNYIIYND